jgi:hypothetical protein
MQVSTATCLAGGMGSSPLSNPSANRWFASTNSFSAGILSASLAHVALPTRVPTGHPVSPAGETERAAVAAPFLR